jgi:hypothetical protein
MKNLNKTAQDLFSKIRGRFPKVTIGNEKGEVTNVPEEARYFDFSFMIQEIDLGKVSISLDEETGLSVIVGKDIVQDQLGSIQKKWYDFLKELRIFSKKRMLQFDVRDITKSNLNKRDYKYLANKRSGETAMSETKMYGTTKTSYQKIGNAKLSIKHSGTINTESKTARSQKIGKLYIESSEGERFKYPYKHLNGARAMARHVSEGGVPYDDFGRHIISLSEEMANLRKFKTYMGRSSVMAESLSDYMDVVNERIITVRKTISSLKNPNYYAEKISSFEVPIMEEVPADVAENWIDQLTIRQFNEELSDVFPYIYKLVSEASKAEELGPQELEEFAPALAALGGAALRTVGSVVGGAATDIATGVATGIASAITSDDDEDEDEEDIDEGKSSPAGGPACWKGKKIGNPKTKMKGGKRVNNCVPESTEDENESTQYGDQGELKRDKTYALSPEVVKYQKKSQRAKQRRKNKDFEMDVDDKEGYLCVPEDFDLENGFNEMMGQFNEEKLDEAYIKNNKDVMNVLSNLRKIGKSIERGDNNYEGNLANEYANDVWSVYTYIENKTNGFQDIDDNGQNAIDAMMSLRKTAKSLETKPDSGSDGKFGNAIVNTLYPVMQWLEQSGIGEDADDADKQKTPLGEFILSYFDRQNGTFPKGETSVLTSIQKDYGDQYVKPAAKFIERITNTYNEMQNTVMDEVDFEPIEEGFLRNLVGDIRNAVKPGVAVTPNMIKELEAGLAAIQAGKQPTRRQQATFDNFMSSTLAREVNKLKKKIGVRESEKTIKDLIQEMDSIENLSEQLTDSDKKRLNKLYKDFSNQIPSQFNPLANRVLSAIQNDLALSDNDLRQVKSIYDQVYPQVSNSPFFIPFKGMVQRAYDQLIGNRSVEPAAEPEQDNPAVEPEQDNPAVEPDVDVAAEPDVDAAPAVKPAPIQSRLTFDRAIELNGQVYDNEADAIERLMSNSTHTSEENSYLGMLARKYDFYGKPENIGPAIAKIRQGVKDEDDKDIADQQTDRDKKSNTKDTNQPDPKLQNKRGFTPGDDDQEDDDDDDTDPNLQNKRGFTPDTKDQDPTKEQIDILRLAGV